MATLSASKVPERCSADAAGVGIGAAAHCAGDGGCDRGGGWRAYCAVKAFAAATPRRSAISLSAGVGRAAAGLARAAGATSGVCGATLAPAVAAALAGAPACCGRPAEALEDRSILLLQAA